MTQRVNCSKPFCSFRNITIVAAAVLLLGCGSESLSTVSQYGMNRSLQSSTASPTTYKATILADNPQLYYRLDESSGTVIADFSGHGNAGTLSGTATYGVAGAIVADSDTALGFNGTNTGITATVAGLSTHYTFEAWVNTGWYPEGHIIDVSPQQLMVVGGQFKFGTGAHYLLSPLSTYGDNKYHYVAATYDGTTKRLYVDGALVASVADSVGVISTSTFAVGHFYGGGDFYQGSIDEVAVYSKALSGAQILNHYDAGISSSTPAPSPTPTNSVQETGTVRAVDPYGTAPPNEQVQISQGSPYTAIDCYSTSSPQFSVGQKVVCIGTFESNGSNKWITASSLSLEGAPTPTPTPSVTPTPSPTPTNSVQETGTVRAVNPYGTAPPNEQVQISQGSPYTAIDCYSTSSPQFSVGQKVVCIGTFESNGSNKWITASSLTLEGSPTPTPSPTRTPTSTPSPSATPTANPSIQPHALTADYFGRPEDTSYSASAVAPWLTWSETTWQANPALRSVGVKVMYYTDPNRQEPTDPMYSSDETTFAHTCSGARITSTAYQNQYLMNPGAASMQKLWQWWIGQRSAGVKWDAIFEDDTNDTNAVSAMPCNYNAASWLAASQAEDAFQAPVNIIYNGLQISNQMGLNISPNALGGMYEGCYSDAVSRPKIWSTYWVNIENTELAMAQEGKLFLCLGRDTSPAASATDGRLYTYASFLLTYTPESSILWDNYVTPSAFRVEPETELIALNPLVAQPSDVNSLQLSSGVYGREYANCYVKGVAVGPCAAVVNPDRSNPHGYPYGTKYAHTLTLSGSGVLDGGSISVTGGVPPTSLGPMESVIVFR